MQYPFSYRLPVGEHDMEGVAHLTEAGSDANGNAEFEIAHVQIDISANSAPDRLVASHIIAWIKQKLAGDEDLQAAWDDYAGNVCENPNAGCGTYAVSLGRVA